MRIDLFLVYHFSLDKLRQNQQNRNVNRDLCFFSSADIVLFINEDYINCAATFNIQDLEQL